MTMHNNLAAALNFYQNTYSNLLGQKSNKVPLNNLVQEKESPFLKFNEKAVQVIWNEQTVNTILSTAQDEKIKVLFPGNWNQEEGPDFKDAQIEINGHLLTGDIEIHTKPEDWFNHKHHDNPNFDKVILHVVWENKKQKRIPEHIPIVELKEQLNLSLSDILTQYDVQNYPIEKKYSPNFLAENFNSLNDDQLATLLQAAGFARLHNKTLHIHRAFKIYGHNQTLYTLIFEALGYKNNRQAFNKLTQNIPIDFLRNLPDSHHRSAIIWGASNLLPSNDSPDLHSNLRKKVGEYWSIWWLLQKNPAGYIPWNKSGSRPQNSPERRLAAALDILENVNCDFSNFINKLFLKLHDKKAFYEALEPLFHSDNIWENFYNFKTAAKSKMKLIGKTRQMDITANIIFPALLAMIPETEHQLKYLLYQHYFDMPKLQTNSKLKIAENRFIIPAERLKKVCHSAIEQQGLLQLFNDFHIEHAGIKQQSFWDSLGVSLSNSVNDIS